MPLILLALLGALLNVACANLRWITSPVIRWVVPEGPVTAVSSLDHDLKTVCETLITVAADGEWLATGGGTQASIWRMPNCTVSSLEAGCDEEERPLHRLNFTAEVRQLQALDDGVLVVVAGGNVTLWNSDAFNVLGSLPHSSNVVAMDVEYDWIFTGTEDGNISMWYSPGISEERQVHLLRWTYSISYALPELEYEITALSLCVGERFLSVGVWEPLTLTGRVLVWNTYFDRMPSDLTRSYAFISRILSIQFAPQSSYLLTGTEAGIISSWRHGESSDVPYATRTSGWPVRLIQFSPNGNWLVGGDGEGHAKLWLSTSLFQGDFLAASMTLEGGGIAAMSADSGFLLMSRGCESQMQQVYAWPLDLRGHAISYGFADSPNGNRDLMLSPNGQYLLTANLDTSTSGRLKLWLVEPDNKVPIFTLNLEGFFCCMMVVGEEHLLTGTRPSNDPSNVADSSVQLWHLPWSQRARPGLHFSPAAQNAVMVPQCDLLSFTVSLDNRHLICGCRTKVVIMQMPTASEADAPAVLRVVPLFGGEAATAMLSFGQSYARYAVGTSAGSVCLEDTSHCFYPGSQINALQVSADGLEIYSGSSNGRICRMFVADMTVGGSCYSQPGNIPTNNVLSLVLQGRDRIASSSTNGILAVWNLNLTVFTNQEPLLVFHTSNNHMRMVISRDQTYYYTSGTAGEIQAYSVDSRPTAVRRMKQSRICQAGKCTTDSVQYHSHDEVAMPPCLQTLPLRSLSLQGARIDGMGPRPPYSLRRVNLSGSSLADWRSMRSGWWSIPSVIDVTHTGGYVTIPILHGEAMRLVTDSNCKKTAAVKEHDLSFCILRSYQTEGQLCAENFNSHDMTREALAANVEGTPLPILTRILVDPEYFQAWLCDCPSGRHGHNGSHCVECPVNFFCPSAGRGNVALNFDPLPCPPNSGTTKTGSKNISDCVCLPGFYDSGIGGPKACQQCPAGTAANNYGQTECQECNFGYRTYSSSDQRSSLCYPDLYGLAFVGVLQLAMIQLVWICWRHFGGLLINDVSQQNGRWIVSACGRRILWIFPWLPNIYHVRFSRTGNPGLDHPQEPIRAIAIPGIGQRFAILEPGENPQSNREFNRGGYLRRSTTNLLEEGEVCSFSSLDTSKGRLYIQCPAVLISGRLIPSGVAFLLLSFLAWPLLMQARERRTWLLAGLGFTSVIATIVIAIASLSAPRPAIQANLSNFRSLLPKPQKVPRGAARALEVESISNLLVQFQFFIGNRNMYYVSTNILLPITEPLALSFAEMVGPKQTKYFVSHYWGTPFEHAMHSVVKHAQLAEGRRWKHAPYWICSFSNNQWDIEEELGSGDLAQSSFYLALTDPRTCATVMLLDEEAKALSRAWCLFEVLQTCLLSQRIPTFQGLLLCTPSGVLNKDDGQSGGSVSIDTAIAVAQTLKNLRLEEAAATNPADKEMIYALVERYPGKHEAMNRFVRAQIRNALRLIKEKHNETFVKLLMELERSETGHLGQTAFAGGIPSMQWKPGTTPDIDAASASAPSVRRSPWGWGSMGASASVAEESSGDSDSEESDSDGETMATALTASRSF